MSLQIYDILKPLPLFQGLGSSEIQDIVAHIRFGFSQFKKGQPIIRREENCRGLVYLINGEMDIMTCGENDRYRLYEHVSAPYLIEPERVFGLRQKFSLTYTATSPCSILTVRKDEVMKLSTDYLVFRMNILNILSTIGQHRYDILRPSINRNPRERIAAFLNAVSHTSTWPKVLKIKMTTLAEYLSMSRLEISLELNKLSNEGIIRLQRGIITFHRTI